jgi:hypothetical protein
VPGLPPFTVVLWGGGGSWGFHGGSWGSHGGTGGPRGFHGGSGGPVGVPGVRDRGQGAPLLLPLPSGLWVSRRFSRHPPGGGTWLITTWLLPGERREPQSGDPRPVGFLPKSPGYLTQLGLSRDSVLRAVTWCSSAELHRCCTQHRSVNSLGINSLLLTVFHRA